MRRLQAGNDRFVKQTVTGERRDAARRKDIAASQHPFAIVLGCADSRVPPEVVFDQGLGDLFVIRVAGEVATPGVLGSVEYAVDHLGCHTIIVLGHTHCGAVEAALKSTDNTPPEGNVDTLIREIRPEILKIDRNSPDALEAAVRAFAKAVAAELTDRSPILRDAVKKGDLLITPACYDLDSGRVEFMQVAGEREH